MADQYTYESGSKLPLSRRTTDFVSRASEEQLSDSEFKPIEQLSAHSYRVEAESDRVDADITRARKLAPAYPAYTIDDTGIDYLVTNRIFVRFRHDCDPKVFAASHGFELVTCYSDRDCLFRIVDPLVDVVDVVRRLTEGEGELVETVDHDLNLISIPDRVSITAPRASEQWYLYSDFPDTLVDAKALIDCIGAWDIGGLGSREVSIGIVDSGCDLSDAEFERGKFKAWAVLEGDQLITDTQPGANPDAMSSFDSHGTLCATLAAASDNGIGGVGAAPACRLVPVKWEELNGCGRFSQSTFISIIEFLRDKVDVVSCSWSLPRNKWPRIVVDRLADSVQKGGPRGKGIVWVWSAGNLNSPIHHFASVDVPLSVESRGDGSIEVTLRARKFVNSFVKIPAVIHVGAISSLGQRCHYSNYGTGLDLVAPSNNTHLYGRGAVLGKELQAPIKGQYLLPLGGTSASAALVAAVAALVRSVNPDLTACEIASILKRTADRTLDMTGYEKSNWPTDPNPEWDVSPIPPFHCGEFRPGHDPDADWSPWFGCGKVNAKKAVEEAMRLRAPL
jgi:hypothetical protein